MKNQYFGDDRDLFKYDLITMLIEEVPSLHRFTFIPLLTPDDDTGHGDIADRRDKAPGSGNPRLIEILDSCRESGRRNISEIHRYFEEVGIPTYIHKEGCYLSHNNRGGYFAGLTNGALENALVFLDPDNGLEVKESCEKHVLVAELVDLYERMGTNSVLMFFQYRPRLKPRADLVMDASARLYELGLGVPLVVAENNVAFFLFAKDKESRDHMAGAIANYTRRYPALRLWNI